MSIRRTGKCHCGEVTVEIDAEDMFSFSCHCTDCMKLVSGGRLLGVGVPTDKVKIDGKTSIYAYPGGSGELIYLHFCPTCSTQIAATPDSGEGTMVVRANVLDDASGFKPGMHIHTDSAFAWDLTHQE